MISASPSLVADDMPSPTPFAVVFEPGNPPVRIIVLVLHDIDVLVSVHVADPSANGYAELVTLDLSETKPFASFRANWISPRTGETVRAGAVEGGAKRSFTCPDNYDWVLHLSVASPSPN